MDSLPARGEKTEKRSWTAYPQLRTILMKILNRVLAVGTVAWRRDWKCLVFWQLWAVMPGELVWKRLVYEYCAKRFYWLRVR